MSFLELSLSENLLSAGAVAAGGALVNKGAAFQRVCLAVRGVVVLTVGDFLLLLGGHHL